MGGLEVIEYTPSQIKSAVTGDGSADKKQIIRMVPKFVTMEKKTKRYDDEYDAIAAGITHISAMRGAVWNNMDR